jgi:SET and MYND domain-containing protein
VELLIRRKHNLISDEEWELLCRLPSHIDDFKRSGTYENIELMAMGAGQFSLSQNMFDKDFIAAMYGRVSCSSRPTSALANSY